MINSEKKKLVWNILEKIQAFFPHDDNRLDHDYIWEQCKIIRNIFIEKLFQEDKRNLEDFYSRLRLPVYSYDADLEIDNPDYDPDDPSSEESITNPDYEPDMPSLKRVRLPSLINLQGNIRYVGPTDRSDEYVRTGVDGFFRLGGRDFTEDHTYYLPFKDRMFFSKAPSDGENDYEEVEVWALLEDPEDDSQWNADDNTLVPKKYQLLLEDMVSENILKYARTGILSRENDATDMETIERTKMP